ncbi:hypothetical protein MUCCIDRAFT_116044 [Mucor lusitanicus CBS 277.49]|uniref:Uncharacterized protein n=1 Tax=Mucor lusitanicus CBS 277.49 TaxID=747725 RepID=A0A168GRP8_MUCCL|nr:hypothetical protein MUCCIDRAFT_116044 [Mucor lusitanicus CBS 277.49]
MSSKLISQTIKRNTIEEVKTFSPSGKGELWECPFCDPSCTVYKLNVPPQRETEKMMYVKRLIKAHVQLHQKDLLSKMMSEKEYEFAKAESMKRVRQWISGTVTCRKLYK